MKKHAEKLYDEVTLKTDAEEPKKQSIMDVISNYQYMLFDQFVRSSWPKDFLSWNTEGYLPLVCQFEGPHKITVRRTDGTYHTEVINVKKEESLGTGFTYTFSIAGWKEAPKKPNDEPDKKPEEKPVKPEKKPDDLNQNNPNPEEDELTPKELAENWVNKNLSWIKEKIEKESFLIRSGDGENEIPETIKDEAFNVIDNLDICQVQLTKDGISLIPAPTD